jgi:hypothetical protein
MKMKILAIFSTLMLCLGIAKAGEFDHLGTPANAPFATIFTNNAVSQNFTNSINTTNVFLADKAIYHTFNLSWTAIGTNSCTNIVDTCVDGASWVPLYTNILTASGTAMYQFTGVSIWFRERNFIQVSNFVATNGVLNIYYAGH